MTMTATGYRGGFAKEKIVSGLIMALLLLTKSCSSFLVGPLRVRTGTGGVTRLFSSASTSTSDVDNGISRLSTLQSLLGKYGAPGSQGCSIPSDLVPVSLEMDADPDLKNLHPHLYPIAKSQETNNYICGLRRCYADDAEYESSSNAPWPIVESACGARGMKLLALNSEHLMRRIAAESDFSGDEEKSQLVHQYNDGLGEGKVSDAGLDAPYEAGSVASLGYGAEKYVLLRVGPFPDLYQKMAEGHLSRGDEQSGLIAAEASNGKFVGFGSTFLYYAELLQSLEARQDEARDAARMCLRLPLPSIGFQDDEFKKVAVIGQVAEEGDSTQEALAKLQVFYEKIRAAEKEDTDPAGSQSGKTMEQMKIDEANYLLDRTALATAQWSEIRKELADIYASCGKEDMASFVDPTRE